MKLHGLAMSCKILLIFAKYFYKNLFLSSLGKYFVLVWSLHKITSKLMKMRPVRNISISILAYAPKMWITFFVQKIYWAKQWKICICCLYLLFLLFVFFQNWTIWLCWSSPATLPSSINPQRALICSSQQWKQIYSQWNIKTPEWHHWRRSCVFNVKFR